MLKIRGRIISFPNFFNCLEGFIAYDVLHFAGVGGGNPLGHAEGNEIFGENLVALIHFFGNGRALVGEGNIAVVCDRNIPAATKKTDSPTHARLRKIHIFNDVDGANGVFLFAKKIYRFKIHFAGFLKVHLFLLSKTTVL